MAKQLHISIPKPCHEDWNSMTQTGQGAFCKSCQKHVIDFSVKTENEIYEIITRSEGQMCGRFTNFQLQQPVRKTEIANGFGKWRAIAASLISFFSFSKLFASGDVDTKPKVICETTVDTTTNIIKREPVNLITARSFITVSDKDSILCIQGRVINAETNEPVAFAKLQLCGSAIGVLTDLKGNFSLELKRKDADKYGNMIEVCSIGYSSVNIHIIEFMETDFKVVKLFMEDEPKITASPVMVTTICHSVGLIAVSVTTNSTNDLMGVEQVLGIFNERSGVPPPHPYRKGAD